MKEFLAKFFDITFFKFIVVGLVNTLFGTAIMFVFRNVFELGYWISTISNYFFGSILSYFMNKFFTFRNNENSKSTVLRFVINISVCYIVAYGIARQVVSMILAEFSPLFRDNVAMLSGMCLFVALNYIGQRYFVFNVTKESKKKITNR